MKLLGVDPGGATGLCAYDTDYPLKPTFLEVKGGAKGFAEWFKSPAGQSVINGADVIVAESFRLDDRTKQPDLSSVSILGWLEGEGVVITKQTPGQGKFKVTRPIIKRAGLYPPRGQVKGAHVVDAEAHVLNYLVDQRHLPTIELLFPKEL